MTSKRQIADMTKNLPLNSDRKQEYRSMLNYLAGLGCQIDGLTVPDLSVGETQNYVSFYCPDSNIYTIDYNDLWCCWEAYSQLDVLLNYSQKCN